MTHQPIPDPTPRLDPNGGARLATRVFELEARHGQAPAEAILAAMVRDLFPGRVALVSSFGAESAVLLHMAARIDPALPVIFIDTGRLFGETKRYRDALVARLGLSDVRSVEPEQLALAREDADGFLFQRDPGRCCFLRKVAPLEHALQGFDAWITGRKAFQGGARSALPRFESDGRRVKVNPLADWRREDLEAYFEAHDLPRHPLEAEGYHSIGCLPCTDRVAPGEDPRAGRWRGLAKTECGIHGPASA